MPSVIEAPINRAEASNSFSPFWLLNRPVERIQINSGILKMRTNVMELGRFTGDHRANENMKAAMADYPPRRKRKAMEGRTWISTSKSKGPEGKSAPGLLQILTDNAL